MAKILGMCAIHYGGEYLDAAIRQAEPYCDKIIMLYSSSPSYGHGTNVGCPESENDLKNIAYSASSKVEWHNITANGEGHHRGHIFRIAEQGNYDGILVFDADEIFDDLTEWIPKFVESKARNIGFTGYVDFWRSFNWSCYHPFAPIRYFNLHNKDGMESMHVPVYHFGCAQRLEIMRYKLLIHGHKNEIRNGWLQMFENWKPGDIVEDGLHLAAKGIWQAKPFDKTILPDILKQHFNYSKDVIL